jgi:hypothetical protein
MRDEERLAHRTSIQKRERENRKEIAPLVHHGSDGKARLPDRPALKLRFDCRWHAASSRVARHADERTDCSMMFVADRKHRHCHCNCHCNREKRGGARRRLTVHRPSRCFDIPWIGSRRLVWSRNSLNANDDNCDRNRRDQLGLQERRNRTGSACESTEYSSVTSFGAYILNYCMNHVVCRNPFAKQ